MAVLHMRFPAGRYHATAWGRNVNEGEPEWPPAPFRLARALMDIWFRRYPGMPAGEVGQALALLAGSPRMSVPASTRAAVKCYQHQNKASLKGEGTRQPMLDAFVCLGRQDAVCIELPEGVPAKTLKTLATLAGGLSYLGRSESWVDVRLAASLPEGASWNCTPGPGTIVHGLLSPQDYAGLPCHPQTWAKQGWTMARRQCSWLEALALSSPTLQEEGWNRHPLLARTSYAIEPSPLPLAVQNRLAKGESGPRLYTFALASRTRTSVAFTVPLAERIRAALMGRHREACGGDPASVSPLFSGKDREGRPLAGHQHAFVWPRDLDGDGAVDHVQVLVPRGLDPGERLALEGFSSLRAGGAAGRLALLGTAPLEELETAEAVASATPFVTGRYYRKQDGAFDAWLRQELRRSCLEMGLPAPAAIEPLESLALKGRAPIHWTRFVRQRTGGTTSSGWGFRLRFETPVRTPFALGRLAHFGLGLFTADKS